MILSVCTALLSAVVLNVFYRVRAVRMAKTQIERVGGRVQDVWGAHIRPWGTVSGVLPHESQVRDNDLARLKELNFVPRE